ncbi:hypothetical protein IAV22_004412 [Salmonella enterica]|nr:hypothetical protein [Salmonella enterica]
MTDYVTDFSIKTVAFMIVTQPVVYVTGRTVTGRGKIQVSGGEPHKAIRTADGVHITNYGADLIVDLIRD